MYRPMRERNIQLIMQISQMVIGLILLLLSSTAPSVMSPDQYGEMAYSIEAEAWATAFMTTSLFYTTFIYINGRWKYSALMRFFAALSLLGAHLYIGVSAAVEAIVSPETFVGYPVLTYSLLLFPFVYGYFCLVNLNDHRCRRKI